YENCLENKTRRIKARDRCGATFNMADDKEFIIMGKDSGYIEEDECKEKQYFYLIDSSSLVFPATHQSSKRRRLVTWFINEFSDKPACSFS
ncbi:hypothetical protein MRX96_052413, partial [Rhipicephalus microplus]